MGYRRFKKFEQIAAALSEQCTVINYDRRGRGDSGQAGPVSVRHEVDDIAALIEGVGGRASLWGWSSGGAVALRAAASDIGVEKLVVYETPVLKHASKVLADVLPNATLRELPGQSHDVSPKAIVPVLAQFVAGPGELPERPGRPVAAG